MNWPAFLSSRGTPILKTGCATIFIAFSFVYLFFFQKDILALQTGIKPTTVGEPLLVLIVIIFILFLQRIAQRLITLPRQVQALSYFPSFLVLSVITAWPLRLAALSFALFMFILWISAMFCIHRKYIKIKDDRIVTLRALWINILILTFFMIFTGLSSNDSDDQHRQLQIERLMLRGQFDKAADAANHIIHANAQLSQVAAFAMSKQGVLGEHLFNIPIAADGNTILPTLSAAPRSKTVRSPFLIYPTDSLWQWLGARPARSMTPICYLRQLQQQKLARDSAVVENYLLIALLLNRDIDGFSREVSDKHLLPPSMALFYRQALVLSNHLSDSPIVPYRDNLIDTDYFDFQNLASKYADPDERRVALFQHFRQTYWYYYFYS